MDSDLSVIEGQLRQHLAGDFRPQVALLRQPHDVLLRALEGKAPLRLDPGAVLGVLNAFKSGDAIASQVQQWASFAWRGHFSGSTTPVRPVAVEIDEEYRDPILGVVARLEELSDISEGYLGDDELDEMIVSMEACL